AADGGVLGRDRAGLIDGRARIGGGGRGTRGAPRESGARAGAGGGAARGGAPVERAARRGGPGRGAGSPARGPRRARRAGGGPREGGVVAEVKVRGGAGLGGTDRAELAQVAQERVVSGPPVDLTLDALPEVVGVDERDIEPRLAPVAVELAEVGVGELVVAA